MLRDGDPVVLTVTGMHKLSGCRSRLWYLEDENADECRRLENSPDVPDDAREFETVWKSAAHALADGFSQVRVRASALAIKDGNTAAVIRLHSSRQTLGSLASGRGSGVVCNADALLYVQHAMATVYADCVKLARKMHPESVWRGSHAFGRRFE